MSDRLKGNTFFLRARNLRINLCTKKLVTRFVSDLASCISYVVCVSDSSTRAVNESRQLAVRRPSATSLTHSQLHSILR